MPDGAGNPLLTRQTSGTTFADFGPHIGNFREKISNPKNANLVARRSLRLGDERVSSGERAFVTRQKKVREGRLPE